MPTFQGRKRRRQCDDSDFLLDSRKKRRLTSSHLPSVLTRSAVRRLNEARGTPVRDIQILPHEGIDDAALKVAATLGGPDISDLRGVSLLYLAADITKLFASSTRRPKSPEAVVTLQTCQLPLGLGIPLCGSSCAATVLLRLYA